MRHGVHKTAGLLKHMRQQYSKLPAVTLCHGPIEVGAVRPLSEELFNNPGRSTHKLIVAAADRQGFEAAGNTDNGSDLWRFTL